MGRIAATVFKAKCLELMDRVAERRETFVITKRGRPVAKLVPVEQKPKESLLEWMRGKVSITDDILGPALPPETWETVREWDELHAPVEPRTGERGRPRSHEHGRSGR
jgi:prevent-host-death family protein